MDVERFVEYVQRGDIPPEPPDIDRWYYMVDKVTDYINYRHICTGLGMWAIVDMVWTKQLADWINGRKVLEIMAGCGWLAKALTLHGMDIIATDNLSWTERHCEPPKLSKPVYPAMIQAEAREAIAQYPADVLICSWPPYKDRAIVRAMRAWGSERPVVYIGEGEWGCTAHDLFFKHFKPIENQPRIDLPQWWGINDRVEIGYWRKQ